MQFDAVMDAYKKQSKQWSPTLNKLADGEPCFCMSQMAAAYIYLQLYAKLGVNMKT